MAQVLTNLPKPGEEQRYVDVINGAGGKQRLCVDASLTVSSLVIGGVYIYDYNSGVGADVIPTGAGNNGLVVVVQDVPKAKVTIFGTSVVAPNGTVTLVTYTVPALKKFFFTGAIIGGELEGEFIPYNTAAPLCLIRNSGSNRTIIFKFPEEPEASAGGVIEIKVKNIGEKTKSYESTLFGYTVDV